jgi:hypothetical protein
MPADLVLGQPDFVTADPGSDAAGLLFAHPYGLVLSQSVLYVTDAGRNRALVYKKLASGNPPADVVIGMPTGSPRSASSLADPRGIAISQNKLFIADRGNQRVLVWNRIPSSSAQPADVVIGQNDFTSAYTKIGRSNLNQPRDVLVLGERLFVSASAENRIQYWNHLPTENGTNPDGVLGQVDFFSALPNAPDIKPLERLSSPAGLAVAGDQLYIADTLNNRLVVRALPSL